MSKPANIKEFMSQQSPNYKRGWEDCLRALRSYLEHEQESKPRLTTYVAAMADTQRYLFEGVGNDKYPTAEYQNALEEELDWLLEQDGVIEWKEEK
jgi:hypothetical protein